MDRPSPYAYLDYREYLAAFYRWKKAVQEGFSYRAFSRRAKLHSPNHLKRVIDGERNLTTRSAEQFANALSLDDDERRCFLALVAFNEAETPSDRQEKFRILSGLRGYHGAQELDYRYAQYHEHWFIPAIRELASLPGFKADAAWIASKIRPNISERQAGFGLDLLFDLGMLSRGDGGEVHRSVTLVTTGPEAMSHHLRSYHFAMLRLAADSIESVTAAERDITSLTFAGNEGTMGRLKEELRRVRIELIGFATAEEQKDPDRLFQLGFYAVPLSKGEDQT